MERTVEQVAICFILVDYAHHLLALSKTPSPLAAIARIAVMIATFLSSSFLHPQPLLQPQDPQPQAQALHLSSQSLLKKGKNPSPHAIKFTSVN
jgi:hypothetical protein